jgi:hypothetical protein
VGSVNNLVVSRLKCGHAEQANIRDHRSVPMTATVPKKRAED